MLSKSKHHIEWEKKGWINSGLIQLERVSANTYEVQIIRMMFPVWNDKLNNGIYYNFKLNN